MPPPTMVFIRRYNGLNLGGHLKFFDYARHVAASGLFSTALYVTPESTPIDERLVPASMGRLNALKRAAAYFIGGLDWRILDSAGIDARDIPVVNLVQGFAHVQHGDPRRTFLPRPALRVCVSEPLRVAVAATGLARGPLVAVENGTDVQRHVSGEQRSGVFIAGVKNPELAREIAHLLETTRVPVSAATDVLTREAFLERLRRAAIAVLLPHPHEGFFLPALEAMALGCGVIVPRIPGVASYCFDRVNALLPSYTAQSLADATVSLHRDRRLLADLTTAAARTARRHTIARERQEFTTALHAYVRAKEPA